MKKFIIIMLTALFVLPAFARDFTYEYKGQTLTYTVLDEDAKTVMTSYKQNVSGEIVIPPVAMDGDTGYAVTSIGNSAFSGCTGLTSVIIPNSVTSIGSEAFHSCTGLTSLTIPNSVTEIGIYAFVYCSGLTSLTIGNSVTSISEGAFYGCSGLTSVTISNSVTSIGNSAFYGCTGLTSVVIPESVTEIGESAFKDCSKLKILTIEDSNNNLHFGEKVFEGVELHEVYLGRNFNYDGQYTSSGPFYSSNISELTISSNVTKIGSGAFQSCKSLTSVGIPNSVTSIGNHAFRGCSGLTSVTIPNSVTSIGEYVFKGCTGLTSVTIPNSVTSIGGYAFEGCTGLTSVTIPNSVTTIYASAFSGCSGLTSVIIPNSVTSIGYGAFSGCTGLKKSAYPSGLSKPFGYGFVISYPREDAIIEDGFVYGPDKKTIYFAPLSLEGEYVVPEFVTSITNYAFYICSGLTSVVIPESVTKIGNYAFYGCSNLKILTIEDSNNNLHFGEEVFEGVQLHEVYLGRNFDYDGESVESGPFYGNYAQTSKISKLTISSNVTELCSGAFYRCQSLSSVIIPSSVTSIGTSAFNGCSNLKILTIEDSNNNLHFGETVFEGVQLHEVYLGRNFDYDGKYTNSGPFFGNSEISKLTISSNVTELCSGAFYGCQSLSSVIIPNSVTSIGGSAFGSCTGLTSITIPNSVTTIGAYAFSGCTGLISVTIPNSVTSIGQSAFEGCTGLTSVAIPNSVTSIGSFAFSRCTGLKKSAYPSGLSNPFGNGFVISYPREDAIIEDGFVYGPDKKKIYFAPLSLEGEYVVPESVTSIGGGSFGYCGGLTSVTIPNSVTSIGNSAFYGCSGLTSVTSSSVNPPIMNDNSFEGLYAQAALSLPENAVNNYLSTNWALFENLKLGDSEIVLNTYETGNLKYRLIPATTSDDKNLAVVIPGNYSSLTEVTIPERFTVSDNGTNVRYYVDGIGFKAFDGCTNLATITFNSRNAATSIGDYAFAGTKISSITIPETVESIGNHAFDGCNSLESIVIPGSVKTVGDYAFNSCSRLKTATLGSCVETIGYHAFDNCYDLTGIVIPGSVKTIGDYAFNNCYDLTGIVIPGSVKTVGSYAFNSCRRLKTATLESGIVAVGDHAFYDTPLTEVTLNEGLESIGASAFSANNSRTEEVGPLYIPSTLLTIGEDAFSNFNCEYVNVSDLASWCDIDFANANSNPANGKYMYLHGEKIENLVIPESVSEIKAYAFSNTKLAAVTIPGNVTAIGASAFAKTNITDLTFAYGTEPLEIAADAFPVPTVLSWDRPFESLNFSVSSLTSLIVGNSIAEIPASRFKGVSTLTSLTFGTGLSAIGDEAFSGCTALTEIILPPSVETIGASAFAGNSKLTSIIMGHKVTSIGEKAFDLCPAQTVAITAQTPPEASDNTFSNYTGSLYVQGQKAVDLYYNADYCWYQFEGHVLIEPTELRTEGNTTITGKPGDTFRLSATLYPENVTLPHIFWRSTNPDVATVDGNGLVTLHADMSEMMELAEADGETEARTCKIIAESLYANGPVVEYTVNDTSSGIDEIVTDEEADGEIDFTAPVEVYNMQGLMVARTTDNLAAGFYIVRQGNNVKKIFIK